MSTEEKTSLSPAPEETAQGGPGVGEKLRDAREQRGVTIEQAAEATRISKRYLEALENDSPMDDLLNPAYGRLFLKNYAKYLDLDPDEVAPPPIEQPRMEPPVVDVLRPAMRPDGRLLSRVLMAAAVIALIGLAITRNYGEPQRETADTPPTSAPTPAQTGPASPNPSPSPSPTPATGLNGVLRVTDRSWVSVTADGENVIRETVDPPRSLTLEADRLLEVILGNGGGVRLRLNGELISTGDPGEVIRLSFAFQDGEVVQEVLPPEPTPESGGGD